MIKPFSFNDISEHLPVDLVAESDLDVGYETEIAQWNKEGVVYLPKFLPEHLLDRYQECWLAHNPTSPGGWPYCTPYMHYKEVRDLCLYRPLTDMMAALIGEPVGLHLNLTGWVSTERKWHQDTYLNPPNVGTFYVAAWIALEDIHPDSGPFQYVPGSHTWPVIRRDKLFQYIPAEMANDHRWPSLTQDAVAAVAEQEIAARNAQVVTYLPKRGDVLLWHSNLMHRGSKPNVPGTLRKSCIAHYSGINHRPDFPAAQSLSNGGWFFPIQERVGVR